VYFALWCFTRPNEKNTVRARGIRLCHRVVVAPPTRFAQLMRLSSAGLSLDNLGSCHCVSWIMQSWTVRARAFRATSRFLAHFFMGFGYQNVPTSVVTGVKSLSPRSLPNHRDLCRSLQSAHRSREIAPREELNGRPPDLSS
jgi:hypothetical protein